MPNEFDQLTNPECLRKECENLLAQVKLHQNQIGQLREQVAQAKKEALEEAIEHFFMCDGDHLAGTIDYDDLAEYMENYL